MKQSINWVEYSWSQPRLSELVSIVVTAILNKQFQGFSFWHAHGAVWEKKDLNLYEVSYDNIYNLLTGDCMIVLEGANFDVLNKITNLYDSVRTIKGDLLNELLCSKAINENILSSLYRAGSIIIHHDGEPTYINQEVSNL